MSCPPNRLSFDHHDNYFVKRTNYEAPQHVNLKSIKFRILTINDTSVAAPQNFAGRHISRLSH
jgi:hypothetical protein